MVITIDRSGVILDARGPIEDHLGYHAHDVIGRRAAEFTAPEDLPILGAGFADRPEHTAVRYPVPFRMTLIGRSGERQLVDVLVSNRLDDPEIHGWVAVLVPHRDLTAVIEPLEVLMTGAPMREVLLAALRELAGPTPSGCAPFNVALCNRFGEIELPGEVNRRGEAVLSTDGTPLSLMEAMQSCAVTEVVPVWRAQPPGTLRDVALDELPLLVAAVARVHGLVAARMATIEVDGRVEVVLLSFYDAESWALVQGSWMQRWERIVRVLTISLDHRRAQHRLELAATHDGLTGLANRQRFNDELRSYRGDLSVLYIDVDRFKAINDRHGHFVGDRVLVEVARRLREVCRSDDLVARLGGDEFGVVLPQATASEATAVGSRIIEAMSEPLPTSVGPITIGVSIGLARSLMPYADPTVAELADRAMYRAKRAGGGRLAIAHPPGTMPGGTPAATDDLLATAD